MNDNQGVDRSKLLAQTAEIVAAHLSNNPLRAAELPPLIESVFNKLTALATNGAPEAVELMPAVPVRRSVTEDYIVCLEDGKRLKTLKRHLMSEHSMTPEEYRSRWGLKPDYPMVTRAFSRDAQDARDQAGPRTQARAPRAQTPKPKRTPKNAAG